MDFANITIGLAFLAGLASFLSPCVFSLVPAYIGYLGGRAAGGEAGESNRFVTFTHGLAFVLGFSLIFVTLGVASSAFGRLLFDLRFILAKVGGIVVIIFGLHMIGVFRIPLLEYDTRIQKLPDRKWGYLSSALMGVFFSAGWAPCVGPVLGAILTLALNGGSVSTGVSLLSAYSAGLAIPFLIAALGVGWVSVTLKKYGKVMHYIEIAMGVIRHSRGDAVCRYI
jgi:cytochrome c-type biogenesis protein